VPGERGVDSTLDDEPDELLGVETSEVIHKSGEADSHSDTKDAEALSEGQS